MKIKRDRRTGKAARLTLFDSGWTIETWWDKHYRYYVTQVKDSNRHERSARDLMELFGSGLSGGTAAWAQMNHDELVKQLEAM